MQIRFNFHFFSKLVYIDRGSISAFKSSCSKLQKKKFHFILYNNDDQLVWLKRDQKKAKNL